MIDLSDRFECIEKIAELEEKFNRKPLWSLIEDELRYYIFLKNFLNDICKCLDFINFGIIVHTKGLEITMVESLLPVDKLNRFINVLTGNRQDKETECYLDSLYSNSFHYSCSCDDVTERKELLERKIRNLKKLGVLTTPDENEHTEITYTEIDNTVSEILDLMTDYGIDKNNIIDSTTKVSCFDSENKKTFTLYTT